jgi:septal ring factor EnvC (AmiA/AmiB activator)
MQTLKNLVTTDNEIIKQIECNFNEIKEIMIRIEKSNIEMKKTIDDINAQILKISKILEEKQKALSEVICKEPKMENKKKKYMEELFFFFISFFSFSILLHYVI